MGPRAAVQCGTGNEAEAGYKASGPCGGPVPALVRVWELKRGSGGEGEFSPRLSDGPARAGGGRPRPPRRVTGGSSHQGGIPPSSSRPADESPCGRGCRSARPPLAQLCSSPPADVCRHPPRPRRAPKTNDPLRGIGGTARGEPRAPGFAHRFIHPSSPGRERRCCSYVASL